MIWYEVLGVSKSASEEDIKAAYRGLVKIYHHDRFIGRPQIERKQAEEKTVQKKPKREKEKSELEKLKRKVEEMLKKIYPGVTDDIFETIKFVYSNSTNKREDIDRDQVYNKKYSKNIFN